MIPWALDGGAECHYVGITPKAPGWCLCIGCANWMACCPHQQHLRTLGRLKKDECPKDAMLRDLSLDT